MIELSRYAKRALRRNEKDFRVTETDADTWIQIQKIEEDMRKVSNKNSMKNQLMLHRKQLKKNLSRYCQSMMEFSDYAKAINKILGIPGLKKEFQGRYFDSFLRGYIIEVERDSGGMLMNSSISRFWKTFMSREINWRRGSFLL